MATKIITARTPTRIDLAGGTLDLWPLYLFIQNPLTINMGINLYAEATLRSTQVTPSTQAQVTLQTQDQKTMHQLTWSEIESGASVPPYLELHLKLLRYFLLQRKTQGVFSEKESLHVETRAQSPAGAGLGGSSALSVALIGALSTWANPKMTIRNEWQDIEIVRDIESTVIQVPAGLQDYYGAMYGSLQKMSWGIGTHHRTPFALNIQEELEQRLLLFYSGQSRNSGINNWTLFKKVIDNQDQVREKFQQIAIATQRLDQALQNSDWEQVGQSIEQEWTIRKSLATGITTSEIDQAFEQAKTIAPIVGKVCGAGGGGCFFIYFPMKDLEQVKSLKTPLVQLLAKQGIRHLDFLSTTQGLEVQTQTIP